MKLRPLAPVRSRAVVMPAWVLMGGFTHNIDVVIPALPGAGGAPYSPATHPHAAAALPA